VLFISSVQIFGSKILLHIVAIAYRGNLSLGLDTQEILKWKMVAIYRLIKRIMLRGT